MKLENSAQNNGGGQFVLHPTAVYDSWKRASTAFQPDIGHFRELADTVEDVFWVTTSKKERVLYVSLAYEKVWGQTCLSLYKQPLSWLEAVHPEDRERVRRVVLDQADGGYNEVYRIIRPDMQVRWIRDYAFPVRDSQGQVERVVGIARDITEYRQMAEQIRHSQKMEAIGQLAGGVAHDFNNILAVIILQAELCVTMNGVPKEVQEGLRQIHVAADRATNLVRQLLLFSRKQIMQPLCLDLNEVVTNLAKMVQRIIGENIHLQLRPHPAPLVTCADPAMLDQVLMNLAINARDAMPGGGPLLIETGEKIVNEMETDRNPDAVPGRYVYLNVSDTGRGIAPEILPRIFEPFFTTKEPGKGTGLGLATVFGIVKQHGGFIEVQSEPGHGAAFKVFLPASQAKPESLARMEQACPQGGSETILLVEDDETVCMYIHALLKRKGYRVLEARNGADGLKRWEAHRSEISLLLTDLMMPGGMMGQELAGKLQQDKPQLKVIFMSGYSAEIGNRQLELRLGENFLQKPFQPAKLLETIRKSLDNQTPPPKPGQN